MSLLNVKHTKKFILDTAKSTRPEWGCSRVSKKAMQLIELKVETMLRKAVHAHPTIGATFVEIL